MFLFSSRNYGRDGVTKNRDARTNSVKDKLSLFLNKDKDWGRIRINVVVAAFCILWAVLWGRAWYLQMIAGPHLADRARRQHMLSELVSGRRGMIYDRNGHVLASSVEAKSVCAWPRKIQDFYEIAAALGPILNIPSLEIFNRLSKAKGHFIYLKRKVDDATAEAVRKAGLTGIGLSREYDRIYPYKHLAGQLLGFVGQDDKGLEGLERSMDARLGCIPTRQIVQKDAKGRRFYLQEAGQPEARGEDVTLTLDVQMQFFAEEAIERAAQEFDARWGGVLIVDVPTGDILAWAQFPFFNPNTFQESTPLIYRNRLASDALEPGSTFKPFVMATALQENKISPASPIDCEGGKWVSKNFTIRDTGNHGILPAAKVLRYSSNIGMAKIGISLGAPTFYKYLHSLGFGERTGVPVAESRGILRIPRDWSEMDILSTSFGQSISVTGLQMAQAYLTLLNGGVYRPLQLVRGGGKVEERRKRIFTEKTARDVMQMMRDVVQEKDGTGKRARLDSVAAAGKTGTAQKADHRTGVYGAKRLASFVGFFPADIPRYLILVMVDEPAQNQFGGLVAAPVFREIASRTLTYAGIVHPANTAEKQGHPLADTGAARPRAYKLAAQDAPSFAENMREPRKKPALSLPGHLAKATERVPDVMGKSVRNAVELFARGGIVPELKGNGARVVRQSPPPGAAWPENAKPSDYVLWLSEN
ncbi:MAG: PASTA domain-containing protein [Desulfovibrio sp.]|jgi:cell division protein FtsI (penicillin-binding protein 3)|nr:PASTA domain-containing protein [Desulfovibrio sp.]